MKSAIYFEMDSANTHTHRHTQTHTQVYMAKCEQLLNLDGRYMSDRSVHCVFIQIFYISENVHHKQLEETKMI